MNYQLNNIYNKVKQVGTYRHFRVGVVALSVTMLIAVAFGIKAWFFQKDGSNYEVQLAAADQLDPKFQAKDQFLVESQSQLQNKFRAIANLEDPVTVLLDPTKTKSFVATVRSKDTLAKVLKRNGIDAKNAKAILALKQAKSLRELHSGKKIDLTVSLVDKTKLKQLAYVIDDLNTLIVYAKGNSWRTHIKHVEPTVTIKYAAATINGSVYTAASKHGIPRQIVAQLANIFNKKANFNKMQQGDRFALFYKEYSVNGKKIKNGDILVAELFHKKQLHRMVGFADAKGNVSYYTPEGFNTQPPFKRFPVSYARIGSRFSYDRYHPILHFSRPHLGVDFVAPQGTPVEATSSGKIDFIGYKGGHGRTIVIKKGPYKTLYAHLSKYADIHTGDHVRQGQIIGYVGSSGLATGSHLHYEFCVDGVHKNPLTIKLPEGEKIAPEYRKRFFAFTKKMLAQLDLHSGNYKMLAMSNFVEPKSKKSNS